MKDGQTGQIARGEDVRLARRLEELEPRYDVIVVGSGYGAGVAASRLARTGQRVCVLERGRERRPGEYPKSMWRARREIQVNAPAGRIGDRRSMFEFHVNDELNALVGCGLGGTSLINANVVEPTEPAVFRDPVWPAGLRCVNGARPLEPYEARARAMLRPSSYPLDQPGLPKLDALERSAAAVGRTDAFRRPSLAVSFTTHTGPGGIEQRPCVGCGDCVTGCNHGSKNTTLMNYLPDAVAHGAEVFCEIEVDRIARASGGQGWLVHVRLLGEGRERFGDRGELFLTAPVVVLGAGALGSTGILLRSANAGLELSPALGTRFSGNADVLAFGYDADSHIGGFGRRGGPPPVVGPCISGIIDERGALEVDDGLVIEEGSVPSSIALGTTWLLAGLAHLAGDRRWSSLRRVARQLVGLARGAGRGAAARTQVYLVMGHDGSDGRLALDNEGDVRIVWPGVGSKPVFDAIDEELRQADRGIGATHIRNPLWSSLFGEDLVTVHPLGGCPMSDDPAQGVVDDVGRVYSTRPGETHHDGLYVVDGAILPRSVGINPLLTITAVAERAIERLAHDRGWAISQAPAPQLTSPARPASIRFTERMRGTYQAPGGAPPADMAFVLTAVSPPIDSFLADGAHEAELVGTCTCQALSRHTMTVVDGRFNLFCADPNRPDTVLMRYRFTLTTTEGVRHDFDGTKVVPVRSIVHLWHDTTTLAVQVTSDGAPAGTADLRVRPADFVRQLTTMRAVDGTSSAERARATRRFAGFFAGTLRDHYGGLISRPRYPRGGERARRPLRARPTDVRELRTDDGGALIRLTRYRGGDKGPVLLVHGAAVSSRIFDTDLVGTNLVEFLVEAGYDTWLLDTRFSTAFASARADSTGDDVARFDHPAAVRLVLQATGARDLQAVVHCYGANTFFMSLLAGLEGVRSVVASQVATHLLTPELTSLKTSLRMPNLMRRAGIRWLDAAASAEPTRRALVVDRALRAYPVPDREGCLSASCRRTTSLYGLLWEHENLDPGLHDHLHELVGPASIGVFAHLAAMVRAGHVVDAQERDVYLPHVDRLRDIPILLVHGDRNECYVPAATEETERWLRDAGHPDVERVLVPGHGHLDCIFGSRAASAVFPHVLAHLERT